MHNGGMIVEETGKARTPGGIYLKLLKDAKDLPEEGQLAALARIKKEGAEAKKAKTAQLAAKRHTKGSGMAGQHAGAATEAHSPTSRAKPTMADFITPTAAGTAC